MTGKVEHVFAALGGPARIVLQLPDEGLAAEIFAQAEQVVREFEAKYSRFRSDSLVGRINAARGRAVPIDAEMARLLDIAHSLYEQSDGAFDATAGVLAEAWDFRRGRPPARWDLAQALERVGWERVRWDAEHIRLAPLQKLDLGGIGKEFLVDKLVHFLSRAGVQSGVVDLAGDLCVLGPQSDGSAWRVGVSDPANPESARYSLQLYHGALCTSGDYQRGFEYAGQRLHHILDARTGWPVTGPLRSVSVLSTKATMAGAICTLAMLYNAQACVWLGDSDLAWGAIDDEDMLHGPLTGPAPPGQASPRAEASI